MAEQKYFDVFLSHHSADKPVVEILARRLQDEAHLHPFLDTWHLVPGNPWQEELEQALDASNTCAVFIGPSGIGAWENEEMRNALGMRVHRPGFRVIPVLLPGATLPERGALPPFLARLTWVEFRPDIHATEAFHRLVAGIRGHAPGRLDSVIPPQSILGCPYRGLEGFNEEHARLFFGREALTQHLVEALRARRFVAVLGPSGSGKSSLVHAGLLPRLRSGALHLSQQWLYLKCKPGQHPLEELAVALARPVGTNDVSSLLQSLLAHEQELHLQARRALHTQPQEMRLCIVVDQCEEIFTLCQDQTERERFIDSLLYASSIPGGQVVVVLTMRADFLAHAASYPPLADALSSYQFLVSPMVEEELQAAIVEPARLADVQCEEELVDAIVQDTGHEPSALPLMEHALTRMWEYIDQERLMTLRAYHAIGGVQGALAQQADALFEVLSAEEQRLARRIMLRLTQPGEGTEDTRRRATKQEFLSHPDEEADIDKVLQHFADARLLVTSQKGQVDVAHEALIRGWPRLRLWLDEDRAALHTHRRITDAAQVWHNLHRDEGALYRGAQLDQAKDWHKHHTEDLNQLERDFIDTSLARQVREEEELEQQRRQELEQAWAIVEAEQQRAEDQQRRAEAERLQAEEQTRRAETEARASKNLRIFATLLAVLLLVAVITSWRASTQQQFAKAQQLRAERQARIAFSFQLATQARNHLDIHDLDLALLLSVESVKQFETAEARTALLTGLQSAPHLKSFMHAHQDQVWSVNFSPDGKTLASASDDGKVMLWDTQNRQPLGEPLNAHQSSVLSVAFSPDGKTLASASYDGIVILWDTQSRQPLGKPLNAHQGPVASLAFSPDGKILASASYDGIVILWDTQNRQPLGKPLNAHQGPVAGLAFSPDGKILASASRNEIMLWDIRSRQPLGEPLEVDLDNVAFSPDGKTWASASQNEIILWDTQSRQPLGEPLNTHQDPVLSLAFSSDGKTLASTSYDGTVMLWDVQNRQPLGEPLKSHQGPVKSLAFSPDGKTLASASQNGTVMLWDIQSRQPLGQPLEVHQREVQSVAFSPDGKTLALASRDPRAIVDLSPDGKTSTSASRDEIMLWDIQSRQPLGEPLNAHQDRVLSLAFSLDGKTLASASYDGTVMLWDIQSRQPLGKPLKSYQDQVWSVNFSPDCERRCEIVVKSPA